MQRVENTANRMASLIPAWNSGPWYHLAEGPWRSGKSDVCSCAGSPAKAPPFSANRALGEKGRSIGSLSSRARCGGGDRGRIELPASHGCWPGAGEALSECKSGAFCDLWERGELNGDPKSGNSTSLSDVEMRRSAGRRCGGDVKGLDIGEARRLSIRETVLNGTAAAITKAVRRAETEEEFLVLSSTGG